MRYMINYFLKPEDAVILIDAYRGLFKEDTKARNAYLGYIGSNGHHHYYEDVSGEMQWANPKGVSKMLDRCKKLIKVHDEGRKLYFASQRKHG